MATSKSHLLAAALLASVLAGCDAPGKLMTDRPIPPAASPGRPIDEGEADLAKLRAAAKKGDTWAQTRLAYLLHREDPEGAEEAMSWLRKAAEAGDASAQALLSSRLRYGDGVRQDGKEAFRWLRAAAEHGLPDEEYQVARIYWHGAAAVPKDLAESRYWFARAAAHGHPEAADHGRRLTMPTTGERLGDWVTGLGDGFLRWLQGKIWPDWKNPDALAAAPEART